VSNKAHGILLDIHTYTFIFLESANLTLVLKVFTKIMDKKRVYRIFNISFMLLNLSDYSANLVNVFH